jgi:hypothetical protein
VPESESMKEAIVIDVKKSKNCKGSNQNWANESWNSSTKWAKDEMMQGPGGKT